MCVRIISRTCCSYSANKPVYCRRRLSTVRRLPCCRLCTLLATRIQKYGRSQALSRHLPKAQWQDCLLVDFTEALQVMIPPPRRLCCCLGWMVCLSSDHPMIMFVRNFWKAIIRAIGRRITSITEEWEDARETTCSTRPWRYKERMWSPSKIPKSQ